ncbi:MAG: nitroreductase family protein [Pseudomonadota bacterium]
MNVADIPVGNTRELTPGTTPDPQFLNRWSPRAMSGEALTEAQVLTLLEAARWAPSCFNAQPWRFAFGLAGTEDFKRIFDCLIEGNQLWAQHAGALIAVIARTEFEQNGQPAPTHLFDAGAAWMSLALQAETMGLITHGMRGFDQDALRSALAVPAVYAAPAVIAVGSPGELDALPEKLKEREVPSGRKTLQEIAFAGSFAALED